jgi:hypothetical protein
VTVKDGLTIDGSMGPGLRSSGCFDRLNGRVSITDSKRGRTTTKTLFYLFDKPRVWRVSEACRGMDGPEVFSYRVESIFAEILPLADQTFLVIDSLHGLVIRLDSDFRTKSKLLGRKIFTLDTQSFESFWADRFKDDELDRLHEALYTKLTSGK